MSGQSENAREKHRRQLNRAIKQTKQTLAKNISREDRKRLEQNLATLEKMKDPNVQAAMGVVPPQVTERVQPEIDKINIAMGVVPPQVIERVQPEIDKVNIAMGVVPPQVIERVQAEYNRQQTAWNTGAGGAIAQLKETGRYKPYIVKWEEGGVEKSEAFTTEAEAQTFIDTYKYEPRSVSTGRTKEIRKRRKARREKLKKRGRMDLIGPGKKAERERVLRGEEEDIPGVDRPLTKAEQAEIERLMGISTPTAEELDLRLGRARREPQTPIAREIDVVDVISRRTGHPDEEPSLDPFKVQDYVTDAVMAKELSLEMERRATSKPPLQVARETRERGKQARREAESILGSIPSDQPQAAEMARSQLRVFEQYAEEADAYATHIEKLVAEHSIEAQKYQVEKKTYEKTVEAITYGTGAQATKLEQIGEQAHPAVEGYRPSGPKPGTPAYKVERAIDKGLTSWETAIIGGPPKAVKEEGKWVIEKDSTGKTKLKLMERPGILGTYRQASESMGKAARQAKMKGLEGRGVGLGAMAGITRTMGGVLVGAGLAFNPKTIGRTVGGLVKTVTRIPAYLQPGTVVTSPLARQKALKKIETAVRADPLMFAAEVPGMVVGGYLAGKAAGYAMRKMGLGGRGVRTRVEKMDIDVAESRYGVREGKPVVPEAEVVGKVSKKTIPQVVAEIMEEEMKDQLEGGRLAVIGEKGGIRSAEIISLSDDTVEILLKGERGKLGVIESKVLKLGGAGDEILVPEGAVAPGMKDISSKTYTVYKELRGKVYRRFDLKTGTITDEVVSSIKPADKGQIIRLTEGRRVVTGLSKESEWTQYKEVGYGSKWGEQGTPRYLEKGRYRYDVKGVLIDTAKADADSWVDSIRKKPVSGARTQWAYDFPQPGYTDTLRNIQKGFPTDVKTARDIVSGGGPVGEGGVSARLIQEITHGTKPMATGAVYYPSGPGFEAALLGVRFPTFKTMREDRARAPQVEGVKLDVGEPKMRLTEYPSPPKYPTMPQVDKTPAPIAKTPVPPKLIIDTDTTERVRRRRMEKGEILPDVKPVVDTKISLVQEDAIIPTMDIYESPIETEAITPIEKIAPIQEAKITPILDIMPDVSVKPKRRIRPITDVKVKPDITPKIIPTLKPKPDIIPDLDIIQIPKTKTTPLEIPIIKETPIQRPKIVPITRQPPIQRTTLYPPPPPSPFFPPIPPLFVLPEPPRSQRRYYRKRTPWAGYTKKLIPIKDPRDIMRDLLGGKKPRKKKRKTKKKKKRRKRG